MPDPVLRYDFGQKFLYLIAFNCVVNLVILVWSLVRTVIQACKRKFGLCKQKVNPLATKKSDAITIDDLLDPKSSSESGSFESSSGSSGSDNSVSVSDSSQSSQNIS